MRLWIKKHPHICGIWSRWYLRPHWLVFNTLRPCGAYGCVSELENHLFRSCLLACLAPSHYLNHCWFVVNSTPRNQIQWNFNRIKKSSTKVRLKYRLQNGHHFVLGLNLSSYWHWFSFMQHVANDQPDNVGCEDSGENCTIDLLKQLRLQSPCIDFTFCVHHRNLPMTFLMCRTANRS